MANFIIFMLLVGGPLIVFIYVRITVKRNAEIRRDQETQRQTAAEVQKREWDREWLELGRQYNMDSEVTADETSCKLRQMATSNLVQRVERFLNDNEIKINTFVDTYSSLGICCLSNNKLFYDINQSFEMKKYLFLNRDRFPAINGKPLGGMVIEIEGVEFACQDHKDNKPFYWTADECNRILSSSTVELNSMNLSDIKLYRIEGGIHYTSDVSGGGVNMEGALAGALLAGGAAAIIGSQIGTEIKTTTTQHDKRRLMLYHVENGIIKVEYIECNNIDRTLEALRKLIPQKEESYLLAQRNTELNM